jgi:hypothetical protein
MSIVPLTLRDRADAYRAAFPARPPLQVVKEQGGDVLYGTWLCGNDYRNRSTFYGSYPPGYLDRVLALFPDVVSSDVDGSVSVLHAFSGSLPAGPYARCDLRQEAEYPCSVYDLPERVGAVRWPLVIADPPYSAADAVRYGTPMVNRRRALSALARVTEPAGHLVWLDCVWPMFSKGDWRTVGRITLIRSTNHRVRLVSIFERCISQGGA